MSITVTCADDDATEPKILELIRNRGDIDHVGDARMEPHQRAARVIGVESAGGNFP